MALNIKVNMPEDMDALEERLSEALANIFIKKLQPGELEEFIKVFEKKEITM